MNYEKAYELLLDKLAVIRELFDESDMTAEGHGMEDMISDPYAVAIYAENKLKRLMVKCKKQQQEIDRLTVLNSINEYCRNGDILSIGEALTKLEEFDDTDEVIFSNGDYFDGDCGSYRGYYKDLYIGHDDKDNGFSTIGHLKEALNKALDEGEMYGYKGGEFPIDNDTLIWSAYYGSTGEMVVDIKKIDGRVYIITKED